MCRPPGRPKSIFDDFGIDFGLLLASRFPQNFDLFRKSPKPRFYWKNNEKSMIFHLRGLPFPPRFLIKFSRSFRTPPKTYFFRPLIAQGHQKVAVLICLDRFWRPARFRGVPKIGQNRPSGANMSKKNSGPCSTFLRPVPPGFGKLNFNFGKLNLIDFGTPVAPKSLIFRMIFRHILI